MVKSFNQMYREYVASCDTEYEAMYFNDTIITSSEFRKRVEEIAKHLIVLGVRQGSGVGYTLNNNTDIIPLFIAIAKLGAYAVPQFAGIPAIARVTLFKQAKVCLIVTNESMVEGLEKAADKIGTSFAYAVVEDSSTYKTIYGQPEEDVDLEQYKISGEEAELPLMIASSSGTTGIPKMVCMTQNNVGSEMIVSKNMMEESQQIRLANRCSMAFPFSTSVMLVLCGMVLQKRSIVFSDDITPQNFLKDIERRKSQSITCPPAYFESLLLLKDTNTYDLSSVTEVGAGMDFCSPACLKRLRSMFPNLQVYSNGYGLVETCNVYMHTAVDITGEEIKDTAKLTLAKDADNIIEVRNEEGEVVSVGEVGELYVKGPNVVKGYMSAPDTVMEAFQDGWLKTGDIARKESEACVTLLGRRKYFIKRGGKSISPIVVQTQINKTEGINASGVVGVPHPLFGEMIWAFVVKDQDSLVSLKDIKKKCKEELPYYMLPDQVTFIESIPKNPGVGKVDYETLRKMAKEHLDKLGIN
ncbi:MAG: class I adenylate-forming enzyme family protein [bacterium]|nr:class I adenylate-forming enzyme family protein [bacterium]